MKVHNFYSDVLLSLSYFINNITNNSINTFQYNIGSRSFTLDYNPNYELPAAYVTYNNTTHMNARPDSFLRSFSNTNQIPVLYDIEKQLGLKIQEDMFLINIDIDLNADSQLHIINLKHDIETKIPLNKFLQFYKFTSYFEIGDDYLNPYLFDATIDTIENLYFKHDKILDILKYCFSVSYEPLIKLTSINFNNLDLTSGNYGLNLSFELMIQIPVTLLFNYSLPSQKNADMSEVKQLFYSDVFVPVLNSNLISEKGFIEFQLFHNDIKYNLNANYIKSDNKLVGHYHHTNFIFDFESEIKNEHITGIISGLVNNSYVDNADVDLYVGADNIIYGTVQSSILSGSLKDVTIENNLLSAYFSGQFNDSMQDFNLEGIEFNQLSKTYLLNNVSISNKDLKLISYRSIQPNSVYSKVKTISVSRTEINFRLTKIKSLVFFDNNLLQFKYYKLEDENIIDKFGQFRIDHSDFIIEGSINKQTGMIDFSVVNVLLEFSDFNLYEIEFDFVFDFYLKRGPGNIEKLSIDFNLVNEFISDISPLNIPDFKDGQYTLVVDDLDINKTDNNRYEFKIKLPYYNKKPITEFSFYITSSKMKTDNNELEIILDTSRSTEEFAFFSVTESFYYNNLYKINKLYPLFFSAEIIR
jgi:hypothetical protein